MESLSLELVLTAHPTEITRRTLIHKMVEVNNCLKQLDNKDIADYEHHQLMRRLRQLIAQSWHTDEIRKHRPSPVDEAKWGFAVVENSLWEGVPNYLRELNEQLEANLAISCRWTLSRCVYLVDGRRPRRQPERDRRYHPPRAAAQPLESDRSVPQRLQVLISELSMVECTDECCALAGAEGASRNRTVI